MNVLGMGPLEILLIVVLALIVFGPAKLPEIMGQVGRAIADFRRATSQLSDEFNRTIASELAETRSVIDETKSAVTGVHTSINTALSGTAASAAAPAATTATATTTPTTPAPLPPLTLPTLETNGTNGTHTEESSPPLADSAQWSWETAAPASGTQTASVASPAAPAAPQIETAQEPPAPTRRPTRTDDLLPPY
jgi:TatA/E family protein of Tat protein translocase